MINLTEPLRWQQLLAYLNHLVSTNHSIFTISSILADIFVFTYPLTLLALYIYGWKNKKPYLQNWALYTVWATWVATLITLIIQHLVWKERPETMQGIGLILSHLPTISFPSDHATVSAWFAMGIRLTIKRIRSLWYQLPKLSTRLPGLFLLFSLIMGVCRIAVAVHRPTDILAWWIIGIIWGYMWFKIFQTRLVKPLLDRSIGIGNNILSCILPKRVGP